MRDEGRRYRILNVLGQGGFGRVYKARMEGPQGFSKEVAIKLLHDVDAPEETLQRFRDESRILGLLRDRAIVAVDPPTRLGGRWAVVMEYVDGLSIGALRKRVRKFPPRVAIGVVQEAARALDKVYKATGPDGDALNLLHRDIKPGNLQLTSSGELKILDFGMAKADFERREAETTAHIGGTVGYMAPERMEGVEGPEGDVYSLGVVLRVMITGLGPRKRKEYRRTRDAATDPEIKAALALADRMCDLDPAERPAMTDVEDWCMELIGRLKGHSLRRWAEQHVTEVASQIEEDELIGAVLTETMAARIADIEDQSGLLTIDREPPSEEESVATASRAVLVATVGGLGTAVGVVALIALTIGSWLIYRASVDDGVADAAAAAPVVERTVVVDTAVPHKPSPAEPGEADDPQSPAPRDAPSGAAPAPAPAPVAAPAATPAPVGATFPITVTSTPLGADVWIDGVKVGSTPLLNHQVGEGTHTLKLQLEDGVIEQQVTVGKRMATRYFWKPGDNLQVSF